MMEIFKDSMRILCLSPHPDDVEFGLGGTINKFKDKCSFQIVVFSDRSVTRGEKNNDNDQIEAVKPLGLSAEQVSFVDRFGLSRFVPRTLDTPDSRDKIRLVSRDIVQEFKPDMIFVPAVSETMQDHKAIGEEIVRVIRGTNSIFGYEVPKHNRYFRPTVFIHLDEAHVRVKAKALDCYSEFTNRYYFSHENLFALARVRALDAGLSGFCEAFEVYQLFG
jgi:LmbE family N-acetylglucosaminyl deacetylase